MSKIKIFFVLATFISILTIFPFSTQVFAATPSCASIGVLPTFTPPSPISLKDALKNPIQVHFDNASPGEYRLKFHRARAVDWHGPSNQTSGGQITLTIPPNSGNADLLTEGDKAVTLEKVINGRWQDFCVDIKFKLISAFDFRNCKIFPIIPPDPTDVERFTIYVSGAPLGTHKVLLTQGSGFQYIGDISIGSDGKGAMTVGPFSPNQYNLVLQGTFEDAQYNFCKTPVKIVSAGSRPPRPAPDPNLAPPADATSGAYVPIGPTIGSGGTPCGTVANPGISTAIGCIHTKPAEFAKDILKFAIGIGGGLAFLMMLLGAFQMLTSAGNPDSLKAGQDRLTSAVIGLLFVIFAVLFLQIIGANILGLPDFKP